MAPTDLTGKHILFIRICGTGMSSVALMAQQSDARVSGVDTAYHPPVSDLLDKAEIACHPLNSLDRILHEDTPDLLVVGNALSGKSTEADMVRSTDIPVFSMPSFLEKYLLPGRQSIVAAGTHGKSTTTTLISEYLFNADYNPSWFIGAIPRFSDLNASIGSGQHFVIEGDEYDTAFFDKGPKFLHYRPDISIISAVEYDHADIYDSVETIMKRFTELIEITKDTVILCSDDPGCRTLMKQSGDARFFTFSLNDKTADLHLEKTSRNEHGLEFNAVFDSRRITDITLPMIGDHNIRNCGALLSFLAVSDLLPDDDTTLRNRIRAVRGLKRRQEFLGTCNGGPVYSDFAHHPTAARTTISGFREFFPEKTINVVFDPATNSNNQNVFQQEYLSVFSTADAFCLGRPPKLHRFPPEKRFNPVLLTAELAARGIPAGYCMDTDAVLFWIRACSTADSVTIIMSNSSFDGVFSGLQSILDD